MEGLPPRGIVQASRYLYSGNTCSLSAAHVAPGATNVFAGGVPLSVGDTATNVFASGIPVVEMPTREAVERSWGPLSVGDTWTFWVMSGNGIVCGGNMVGGGWHVVHAEVLPGTIRYSIRT